MKIISLSSLLGAASAASFYVESETGQPCSHGTPISTPEECAQVAPTLTSIGKHGSGTPSGFTGKLTYATTVGEPIYIPGCVEGDGGFVYFNSATVGSFGENQRGHALCKTAESTNEISKAVLCHVSDTSDVNAAGPHMRDGTDVFGKDWIKYYSAATDHNGQPTRLEATSAASCCEACYDIEGCDYWTYVKNSTACYIKHQDNQTVYLEEWNPSLISGISSPHEYNYETYQNNGWHSSINFEPNSEGKRRLSTSDALDTSTDAPSRYLMGIDFMGADWVKFSNRRFETYSPESCEEACENDPHCCYWTWSAIDPDEACYLKSTVPMTSRDFGYGQKVYNFAAVSGYSKDARKSSRCEDQSQVASINASAPVIYPVGIFRRHFDRFAETSGHKFFPTRPSLYMIGSGIDEAYINGLTKGQYCSNTMDLNNPCFTEEEITALLDQFQAEKDIYCNSDFTADESHDYQYFGGHSISC